MLIKYQTFDIQQTVAAWRLFIKNMLHWQKVVCDYVPRTTGCGIVYELPNFLNRPNEDFAIVDMRNITVAQPHYHPDNNYEIYFALQGSALIVVKTTKYQIQAGDFLVIPPNHAHFTIPDKEFVLAVVNTPPYKVENHIVLTESNAAVGFDYDQFKNLICADLR